MGISELSGSRSREGAMSERTYAYDAIEAGKGTWMVHRRWIEQGSERMDEASLYGDYTAETAIKAAIERNSWA